MYNFTQLTYDAYRCYFESEVVVAVVVVDVVVVVAAAHGSFVSAFGEPGMLHLAKILPILP